MHYWGGGEPSFFKKVLYDTFSWIFPNFRFSIRLSMASLLIYWIVLLMINFLFVVPFLVVIVYGCNYIFSFFGVSWYWLFLWLDSPCNNNWGFSSLFITSVSLLIDYFDLRDLCEDYKLLFLCFEMFLMEDWMLSGIPFNNYFYFWALFIYLFFNLTSLLLRALRPIFSLYMGGKPVWLNEDKGIDGITYRSLML